MSKRVDLTGQKFGKLTVIKYDHTEKPVGKSFWLCECECGKETVVYSGHLKNGHTKSCGCLQVDIITKRSNGNTWGRKYETSQISSAKHAWQASYTDGCSFETFMILSQQPCYYCGEPPSNRFNKYITKRGTLTNDEVSVNWAEQGYFTYNGLDRIDSSVPHLENNIVPCCLKCNQAKNNMSVEEFKIWITKIYNHFIK